MNRGARVVGDVMTAEAVCVGREATFKGIVRALHERGTTALPVVDGAGRVVGVVSEADLLRKAGATVAGDLMTSPAVVTEADDPVARAARTMASAGVGLLPVVDAYGRLCGVLRRADLLKVHLRPDEEIAADVRGEIAAYAPPDATAGLRLGVSDGIVTIGGRLGDAAWTPVVARLARSVGGVVDVVCDLDTASAPPPVPGR